MSWAYNLGSDEMKILEKSLVQMDITHIQMALIPKLNFVLLEEDLTVLLSQLGKMALTVLIEIQLVLLPHLMGQLILTVQLSLTRQLQDLWPGMRRFI